MLRNAVVIALLFVASPAMSRACEARDFIGMTPEQTEPSPMFAALMMAYPGVSVSPDEAGIVLGDGTKIDLGSVRDTSPADWLSGATLAEQFNYVYPLEFNLDQRPEPFFDPGRIRNDAFFKAMYFSDERQARLSLVKVDGPAGTESEFWMTEKWGAACQLEAAMDEITSLADDIRPFFQDVGGSFNWRQISGTSRLSAHSFGISIDINAQLGKYWKWTGAKEGNVVAYSNEVPGGIVKAMERYGFIWGGKWHHFDGMHFEYRPELILYSRLVDAP